MQKKLKQAHGNWVEGDRFWDRESDIALLTEKIDEGAHVLLVAQRRMGKTSLMKEIKRQLASRYICLFVDLQKAMTSEDTIVEISLALKPYNSLWNKTKDLFSNVLSRLAESIEGMNLGVIGIKFRAGLTSANWAEKGPTLRTVIDTPDASAPASEKGFSPTPGIQIITNWPGVNLHCHWRSSVTVFSFSTIRLLILTTAGRSLGCMCKPSYRTEIGITALNHQILHFLCH